MRRSMAFQAILIILSATILVTSTNEVADGKIQKATLAPKSELIFSYDFRNTDNTATRTGTLDATVKEVKWRGYDSFMFDGSIKGTFWTQSGSGTESGTWSEYYRKGDLAFLDQTYITDMVIGVNKVTNTTNLHYDPSLTWIEFPLEYVNGPEKSIWSTNSPVLVQSTWDRVINGDNDTKESGSENVDLEFDWVCADLVRKDVSAGTFDTYWIREWVRDDDPRNQTTDYFYNETLGWWVQKDVYVDDSQGERVRIKHYELVEHSVNGAPLVMDDPQIEMGEDTTDDSVDLDLVFSDPDEDPLLFTLIESNIFSCIIDPENRLLVTPPKDFYGNGSVTVSAKDDLNDPVEAVIPVEVRPVDDLPVLSEPSISPSSGDGSTLFTYSIISKDIDTAEPSKAEVMIDSAYYPMAKVSGDNRTGILLKYSTNLEPGEHTYRFRVDGTVHPSAGTLSGPTVTVREEPFLEQGRVVPLNGDIRTDFTFEVTWIGPNGEVPDEVRLVLDKTEHGMVGKGDDPVTGIHFSDSRELSEGGHSFHFRATLGENQFRFPESGEIIGPDVAGLEDPYLKDGKVGPEEGGLSTEFTFKVTWIGPNGETPSKVLAVIDDYETTLSKEGGTPVSGIIYSGTMDLDEGDHTYHFKAILGSREFSFPLGGELEGPTVHSPEMGECGYHLVSETKTSVTFLFFANYEYLLDVYPTEAQVILNGDTHSLSDQSGFPTTGMNCSKEISLGEGTYTVVMMFVVDGVTLTEDCDDLVVKIDDGEDDDGEEPDDDGGPDDRQSDRDQNGNIVFIIVMAVILLAVLAILVFIVVRREGYKAGKSKESDDEYVIRSSWKKK